jgi:RNA polymerase sigma-70 factor, ECF subfamily
VLAKGVFMTFAEEVWQRRDLLMKIARYDEDLVQETVYTALRNELRFQKGTNLNGWLVTILKNLRKTRHRKYRLELQVPEFVLDSRTVNPVGSARLEITEALDVLKENTLKPLLMAHAYGHSYHNVAEEFGIALGTVKSRLHRAIKQMESS